MTAAALLVFATTSLAQATLSDAVVAAFRGKILLSRAPTAAGANDKETIAKLKAARLVDVVGAATDDGMSWHFAYAAFLEKVGNLELKLRFISGEQDRRFVTDRRVPILDPQSAVLRGELTVTERDGLERDKAYVIQLVNGKGEIVAKTSALFK